MQFVHRPRGVAPEAPREGGPEDPEEGGVLLGLVEADAVEAEDGKIAQIEEIAVICAEDRHGHADQYRRQVPGGGVLQL
eukprot:108547-Prorocentrum_minimum.AAC.1